MTQVLAAHAVPSWLEATARERVRALLDKRSFVEFIGPQQRETSPHLPLFELPCAFDDGIVIGRGLLAGRAVWLAAQESRFMGGTFGEVSGAKLVGLLRAARVSAQLGAPHPVLLALDSGGVRLQEANAGEIAVSETIRALLDARRAGVRVIGLVGGRSGAFGGAGITAACCTVLVISRHGRTGVSGPEVIETNRGVEEFDAKDRALVWRITGGRTRTLMGSAQRYVADTIDAFRNAAISLLDGPATFDMNGARAEQRRLAERLAAFGECRDAPDLWRKRGLPDPERVAEVGDAQFVASWLASEEIRNDAR
ncbi:biotin-independent malonate decarboxylase subunit beta [Trinickia sp. LjRoot230]|uniref:biotin-independent malonate decarboxylase subunit beta n=1 Tax=Trinickia sp. LjRoot230 TaxID=3342288 RepID=UPI003ECE297A